ncbi:Cyclase family protein [Forsythia ovata]|uniref:Cyclase family protein n=1 Tax=Forsythia ovata TaxID=205694 RepID=A0ABD1QMQ4_9LAMI
MRMNSCSALWFMILVFSVANDTVLLAEQDVLANANFVDISHEYVPGLPKYDSPTGLGTFMKSSTDIRTGSLFNTRNFNLSTDCGTHVKAFTDVESLDLTILNGPVLVVEVPKDKNITAEVMQCLNIPRGVKRVIFKTLNTERDLMHKTEFDSSYTGFQKDGAEWLVNNTDIKLIGLDYLSVAVKPDRGDVYQVLGKDVIPVEGLKLDKVNPGEYFLHCLPLRMSEAKGAPTRCILVH